MKNFTGIPHFSYGEGKHYLSLHALPVSVLGTYVHFLIEFSQLHGLCERITTAVQMRN